MGIVQMKMGRFLYLVMLAACCFSWYVLGKHRADRYYFARDRAEAAAALPQPYCFTETPQGTFTLPTFTHAGGPIKLKANPIMVEAPGHTINGARTWVLRPPAEAGFFFDGREWQVEYVESPVTWKADANCGTTEKTK